MNQLEFFPGDAFLASDSPNGKFAAFFEDEGKTGYFYAVDLMKQVDDSETAILDALHVYNVQDVVDGDRASRAVIVWDSEGVKCALLINGYAHAAFDFAWRRGYCRKNYPTFPDNPDKSWITSDHTWSDEAIAWLSRQGDEIV